MKSFLEEEAEPDTEEDEYDDKADPGHFDDLEFLVDFERFRRVLGKLSRHSSFDRKTLSVGLVSRTPPA